MTKIWKTISVLASVFVFFSHAADAQEFTLGDIIWTGANFCPRGTIAADGGTLPISSNTPAFSIMSIDFGGDGRQTFEVPDLRVTAPVGVGRAAVGGSAVRRGQRFGGIGCPNGQKCSPEYQSFLGLTACVVMQGIYPARP